MTKDIMIDLTSRSRTRHYLERCYFCPDHPAGKPILPTDKDAYKNSNNQWVCGTCARENVKKSLSLFGARKK